jgi:hypothetical protein
MKFICTLVILSLLVNTSYSLAIQYPAEIMKRAESQLYVRELHPLNGNKSPEIDGYLAYLGLPVGLSYCLSFCIFIIGKTYEANGKRCPVPKIGKCSTFLKTAKKDKYTFTVHDAKKVEYGIIKLKPAMLAIWSHKKKLDRAGNDKYDWDGHAELMSVQTSNVKFNTVGANTTGVDDVSQQREQTGGIKKGGPVGGVWAKNRTVSSLASFRTEAFIEVN